MLYVCEKAVLKQVPVSKKFSPRIIVVVLENCIGDKYTYTSAV